jgi:uncharacterized protein
VIKRFLYTLAGLGTLGYGGAVTYLKVNEQELVFHPAERAVASPAASWDLRHRSINYRSTDGTRLNAWIVPGRGPDSTGFWLLVSHGNYGNIGYGERPEFYAAMRDLGLNLFAYDYRGFGESEGSPTELGLYEDAVASYRFLTDTLGVSPSRIIIFGHSLGSGVATELATRVKAAALVVEGGYTSVPDRGQELYPFMPVRLIAGERFESIAKVPRITIPKLYLHSPTDDIIPFHHAEQVVTAAAEPKRLVPVRGGHMLAFREDAATYFGAIRELVKTLP